MLAQHAAVQENNIGVHYDTCSHLRTWARPSGRLYAGLVILAGRAQNVLADGRGLPGAAAKVAQ